VPEINAIKTLISHARTAQAVTAQSIGFVIQFGNCQKVNTAEEMKTENAMKSKTKTICKALPKTNN